MSRLRSIPEPSLLLALVPMPPDFAAAARTQFKHEALLGWFTANSRGRSGTIGGRLASPT
jgi:hypothetical protein